jgi:RNA polymerase sigma-70 factor (ECF subfamily)
MPRSPASIQHASDAPTSGAPRVPTSAPSQGATQTWDTALETYYVELCEYVLRLVGSAEAAQDLVQDLFLRLWNTRGPRDAERLTRPYLYASARNAALKYLRHRRVVDAWIERASREEMPTADSPSDLYLRRELEDAVARAIADLPTRCREIFLLRRRDQLSYQEIATRAGVSLGTVKCHMWRAMVLLREKLAPYLALVTPVIADRAFGPYPF